MGPPSKSTSLYCVLILLLCAVVSDAQSTCYRPDGIAVPASYQPCNTTAPASMCCNIGNGEACNSVIGLCGSPSALWRESCTDPTWQAPACLRLCITGLSYDGTNDGPASEHDAKITVCGDGSYCCGPNNLTGCNAGEGVWIVNGQVMDVEPSSSTSSSTSSTILSTTASSTTDITTSTSAAGSSDGSRALTSSITSSAISTPAGASGGLRTSGKIGLGVGLSGGIIVLSLVCGGLYMRKRQRGRAMGSGRLSIQLPVRNSRIEKVQVKELQGSTVRAELP